MKSSPKANLQLVYVTDVQRSTAFYEAIFKAKPVFTSPCYVAFAAGEENYFAIWSRGSKPNAESPRFSEVGIMLRSAEEVERLYEEWQSIPDVKVVQKPYDDVFGRTFLVADPDGHIIRVCLID